MREAISMQSMTINGNQRQSVHAQRVLATFFEALPEGEV
jgi:hypothetical protein